RRPRAGQEGAAAARIRPGEPRAAGPQRPRPLLRRAGRVRDRARPGRGGVPGPARRAAAVSLIPAVRAATGREPHAVERVAGGDINEAFRVQFADGSFAFVKTRAGAAPGEYAVEAAGLRWLAEAGGLRVPDVLGVSDEVLVLDWVDQGARGDAAAFGAGLAATHPAGADDFVGPEPPR